MSPPTLSPADALGKQQRAFLLHQLANSANGMMTAKQATAAPKWAKEQLALTPEAAAPLLEQLMAEQLLIETGNGAKKKVGITPQGREHLDAIQEFIPRPLTDAELKASEVRAKAAGLNEDELVAASKLGKPKASAAPEVHQAFKDTLNELLSSKQLHQHGTKYGKQPPPTAEQVLRGQVLDKLATLGDQFTKADLSKPKRGATADEKQAHADALDAVIAEIVAAGKLFLHPGGKYGQKAPPTFAEVVRKQVEETLANKAGPFTLSALSKPKKGASPEEQQSHADALTRVIAELVEAKKLFPHSGGKYGQLKERTPADDIRDEVAAKLPGLSGSFRPEDLSQPKDGAKKGERKTHADALATVVAELVEAKTLFRHPSGRLSKEPYVDPHRELREVYVLHQFSRAPNRTITRADIELAFPGKGKPELKALKAKYPHVARFRGQGCFEMGAPATRQTLEQLVAAGYLWHTGEAEAGEYTLTDAGVKRLEQARAKFPVLPPVGDPATPDDAAMREMWEAFVLLRLTEAADLTGGESVVFVGGYPKGSKLNEATAWVLYGELAKAGHVTAKWNGTEGEYTLTPKGLRHLAGLSFDGFAEVKIKGTALTALLSAARGGEKATTAPTPPTPTAPPADLESAVMDIFHRLLRERHANIRMVPIHEVRAEVRERFGDRAASHEVFDDAAHELRRQGRLRLIPIDNRSRVSEQELRDSIDAAVGTLFYMENVDASGV